MEISAQSLGQDTPALTALILCLQNDGGSPVNNYIVEKKPKKSGKWTPVSKFVRGTQYEVTDLDEGEEYEFRVCAVNDQGVSEPLNCDKPIIAKHQFGEHQACFLIWVSELGDLETYAEWRLGSSHHISLTRTTLFPQKNVSGVVIWSLGNNEILLVLPRHFR